jgi:ribosomal protein S18 acetylase RimI-like enzyme
VPLEVRHAVPDDAPAIADVHVRAWQVAYRGLIPDETLDRLSVEQREEAWRQAMTGEECPAVYVAVKDGAVVGFCAAAAPARDVYAGPDVAEIGAIYVEPDLRRSGVGRALMNVALDDLRAAGWRSVTLWVLAENERALRFYGQYGFEPDGAETAHEGSGEREVRLRAPLTRVFRSENFRPKSLGSL